MGEGGVPEAARGAGLDLPRCHGLRALKLIQSLRNTKRNPFAQKEGGGVNFIEGGELRDAFAVDGNTILCFQVAQSRRGRRWG